MARQRITGEQRDVDHHDHPDEPDPPALPLAEREEGVLPQEEERDEGEVQEIPVDVLEDEREGSLERVAPVDGRLANGTAWRIREIRPVIRLAVVVAGGSEAERDPQDQDCRREPRGQPVRADQGREERREIAAGLIRRTEHGTPDQRRKQRVDDEGAKAHGDDQGLSPPGLPASGRAHALRCGAGGLDGRGDRSHGQSVSLRWAAGRPVRKPSGMPRRLPPRSVPGPRQASR